VLQPLDCGVFAQDFEHPGVVASACASQSGPFTSTARKLILVAANQKIIPGLDATIRRNH